MIIQSNALHIPVADNSVQCVITSPPYYGLRDYGTALWEGGSAACDHQIGRESRSGLTEKAKSNNGSFGDEAIRNGCACPKCGAIRVDNQIGLEESPREYIEKMVAVFAEVWRVLRNDGTVWLNLGDSYNGNKKGNTEIRKNPKVVTESFRKRLSNDFSLKPKDLMMLPHRVAIALQEWGWWVRNDIVWAKKNCMPESVNDRCTRSHEYIFLLAKSEKYYYDADAIREPYAEASLPRAMRGVSKTNKWLDGAPGSTAHSISNPRLNVKHTNQNTGGNGKGFQGHSGYYDADGRLLVNPLGRNKWSVWNVSTQSYADAHFATFPEKLIEPCVLAGTKEGDLILDPFAGSGTTGVVASKRNRQFIGLDLNFDYCRMAVKRIATSGAQRYLPEFT